MSQNTSGHLPQSRRAGRSRECRLRQGFQRRLEAACRSALRRTAGRLSRKFQRVDRWIGKAWRHSRHQAPMGRLPWHGAGSATAPPRYPDNRSGRRRNEHRRRVDGTTGVGTRLCRRSCRSATSGMSTQMHDFAIGNIFPRISRVVKSADLTLSQA